MRHTEHAHLPQSYLHSVMPSVRRVPQLRGHWRYAPLLLFVLVSAISQAISMLFS